MIPHEKHMSIGKVHNLQYLVRLNSKKHIECSISIEQNFVDVGCTFYKNIFKIFKIRYYFQAGNFATERRVAHQYLSSESSGKAQRFVDLSRQKKTLAYVSQAPSFCKFYYILL